MRLFTTNAALVLALVLPAFAGHEGPELWVHPNNQHPNEIANGLAGRALADWLRREELVR